MSISRELISLFVKATKDDNKTQADVTMYGTVVYDGRPYVKIDGSDLLTPVATTTDVKDGERVTVMIKNHTATVTGNLSSPSARTTDVKEISGKISEFEIVMAYKVTAEDLEATNATIGSLRAKLATIDKLNAVEADIETLEAKFANLKYVDADDIEAITATIESLEAKFGTFTDISTDDLDALTANITTLRGYTADFTYVSADILEAVRASVKQLDADKLSAKDAEIKYANIDFANIGKAAMEYFYARSGLIKNVIVGDQTITGELVGVTFKGDLIEGNTVKADKLVVKGSDGLYYKLNFEAGTFTGGEQVPTDSLHGSVITAKSITATKISVKDLVAFDATIGGFKITDAAIHSGVKETVDNSTQGIYLDSYGQLAVGDNNNYIKYYKDADGTYKLAISAGAIRLSASNKDVEEGINDVATSASDAQISANSAQSTADSALDRVSLTETLIEQLETCISMLVTDGTGGSLMTQTEDGWTFNMASTHAALKAVQDSLIDLNGKYDNNQHTVEDLDKVVKEQGKLANYVRITTDGNQPCIELGAGNTDFKLRITNTDIRFMEGSSVVAYINNQSLHISKAVIEKELQQGNFVWTERTNGNMGLMWKE